MVSGAMNGLVDDAEAHCTIALSMFIIVREIKTEEFNDEASGLGVSVPTRWTTEWKRKRLRGAD